MAMRPGSPQTGMAGARQNANSRLASLGMPSAPGEPTGDQGKQPLQAVNYRAADTPQQACGNCDFFTPPESCDLVAGNIDAKAVCDLWKPAEGNEPAGESTAEDMAEAPPTGGPPPTMGGR